MNLQKISSSAGFLCSKCWESFDTVWKDIDSGWLVPNSKTKVGQKYYCSNCKPPIQQDLLENGNHNQETTTC